jgi:hypothetical protein
MQIELERNLQVQIGMERDESGIDLTVIHLSAGTVLKLKIFYKGQRLGMNFNALVHITT